jgi:cytochrome c556
MRNVVMGAGVGLVLLATLHAVRAREAGGDLPAGPVRDRHELMEAIGKQAKVIGNAMKAGRLALVAGAADTIATDAAKITALFPPGSTDPKSRAKPEIWKNWPRFEAQAGELQTKAVAVAAAAKDGGDVHGAANAMFETCKSCHDQFRTPEKKG